MIIGYARVSTTDQKTDLQRDALIAHGCTKIYQDAVSGVKARPQLELALSTLARGDTLMVWRLDRAARSLADLLRIVQQIQAKGAYFKSLNESIETGSATGRLVLQIMGAIAEFERCLTHERVNAGVQAAKSRGVHCGRPHVLTQDKRALAQRLLGEGQSPNAVAKVLGVSRATVYRLQKAA